MTSASAASSLGPATVRDAATDALGYWEPRRLIYDAVLAAVVITYFFAAWPESRGGLSVDLGLTVFLLAVVANVLYCFAYVADVFVQLSDLAGIPRELASDSDRIMPGDGDFQLQPILDHFRKIGYEGWVSLELMNPVLWEMKASQVAALGMQALNRALGAQVVR